MDVRLAWLWLLAVSGATAGLATGCLAGTLNARVTGPDGAAVANAIVSASPAGQGALAAKPGTKATMIQKNKQFMPFVLPIQVGTTVDFPNNDPFRHQVYSFSRAKSFEIKLYGGSEVGMVTFDKEGAVALGCNIHDNMLAYVYVVGTPYFAAADPSGVAALGSLPAGSYTVKVWHPNQTAGSGGQQDVQIGATGSVEVTLPIALKRDRRQRKPGAIDERDY